MCMRCLKLFDGYCIVATPMTWVVSKPVKQKDGTIDNKPVAFCPDLDDAIMSAIRHDIRVTDEVRDINEQIKEIQRFIKKTIGSNVRVKNLFEEVAYAGGGCKDEEDPLNMLNEEDDPLDFLK